MLSKNLLRLIFIVFFAWSGSAFAQLQCSSIFSDEKSWTQVLEPSVRPSRQQYTFLVHALRSESLLNILEDGKFLPSSVPYLFTSLISEKNNQTIWNSPGIILKGHQENIVYTSLSDTKGWVRDTLKNSNPQEIRKVYKSIQQKIGVKKVDELLNETSATGASPYKGYNEILVKNDTADKNRPEVFGFFYFVDAQGNPILNSAAQVNIYKHMLDLSYRYHLPMIPLKPTSQKSASSLYMKTESLLNRVGTSFISSH
ncbi:MAG: hypothetical protein ACKOX6_04960 [Bdellovibrio sp.]